ncbi:hypothetical protein GKC32_10945 (plasmid) [Lactobacillus curvatus]|nr:hypothetical protein [Latilactobacillus curvatus]MSD84808.1 hypothetical protein [Latilactobacillus curvatus]MSE22858.1 hypothetical protein [Latilactobacillus curvatus]MSE24952.1 hypothetical protein [Latilactobacillus curvatus]
MQTKAYQVLNNFEIKLIGIILMFIDHVHQMFAGAGVPGWVDWFGRPVATIFFFMAVEGFTHTRNQKRYMCRLLIGFWVMNLGSRIVQQFFEVGNLALSNNIFTDLFIAVLAMYGIQEISAGRRARHPKQILIGGLAIVVPILVSILVLGLIANPKTVMLSANLAMVIPNIMLAENGLLLYIGVFFYLFRNNRLLQCLTVLVFAFIDAGVTSGFAFTGLFTSNTQWMMIFAIIPILLYNGQKGPSMKYFFYLFYPIHIWLLFILASLMGVGA